MENAQHGKDSAVEFKGSVASAGSDGDRVSWLPRRREQPPVGGGNTVRKLMRREIGGLKPHSDAAFCAEKFRRFTLQDEFLVQADTIVLPWTKRSIRDIIAANDFVFVTDWSGYCVAFCHTANGSIAPYKKNGRIWYFNNFGEDVETLFYNKMNDSIITISSTSRGVYNMRAPSLESIRRCDDDLGCGTPVFGSKANYFPFFDDHNSFTMVCLDQNGHFVNNIYEMKNYELIHFIRGQIDSIVTRPGIMIVAYKLIHNYLPIEVFSTENWAVLKEVSYSMPPCRTLQFFELCQENILLQENAQKMQLIDIWNNNNVTSIERSEYQILLSSIDLNATDIDVTRDKKFVILYSSKIIENPAAGIYNRQVTSMGSINIRSTFNGKSILNVNPWVDPDFTAATTWMDSDNHKTDDEQGSTHESLKNVSALFYDEEHHRIYTGNKNGFIHVWSN